MGLFNPFYYISYFIKCIIRNFSKRYFKIILLFLIIIILIILYTSRVYAIDINNINFVDVPDSWFSDWIVQLPEYISGDYYYATGLCYDGTGVPSTSSSPYIIFFEKEAIDNGAKVCFYKPTSFDYLFYMKFSQPIYTSVYNNSNTPMYSHSLTDASNFGFNSLNTENLTFESNLPVIYSDTTYTDVIYSNFVNPYFSNSVSDLETFNFDYFTINGGTMPYKNIIEGIEHTAQLSLDYNYKGVRTNIDLKNYLQVVDNTWIINIPYNVINNNVLVKNGENFYYRFTYSLYGTNYSGGISVSGTYNLTTDAENTINAEGNKELLNQLQSNQNSTNQKLDEQTSAINNQTNKIQDLNDNISDSNVDDFNQNTLPSDSTNDITQDGVNGIFTSIYNAFCTGEPVNIDFPIPNTNKSISLSPSYVYDSLSNFGGGFVVTLIQTFWWYLISRFIVKDIVDKINKIKSGNIENIETTNIRGDML